MNSVRCFIADMDSAFVRQVCRLSAENRGLDIIGTCPNGLDALRQIALLRPDVVLADIQLPGLDGISLLNEIHRLRFAPVVIICTRFYSEFSMECASRCGASFFLYKPVNLQSLPQIIRNCCRNVRLERGEAPPDSKCGSGFDAVFIRHKLSGLGMMPRLSGNGYLADAVLCIQEDSMLFRNLTQGLYAVIAERNGTTVSRVERAMRNAISVAYNRGALSGKFDEKPTNKQFIAYLLRALEERSDDFAEL